MVRAGTILNATAAALFGALALLAAIRLARRIAQQCPPHPSTRAGNNVLISLLLYATVRTIQLVVFSVRAVDTSGDFKTHVYTFLPAVLFMTLQSTLLIKWVYHVDTILEVLHHRHFQTGNVLIHSSVALIFLEFAVMLIAVTDTEFHYLRLSPTTWNALVDLYCGAVYIFNGACFIVLGGYFRFLWVPMSHGVGTSVRVLLIALVFGVTIVARGLILSLYTFSQNSVRAVTHSSWGAPVVLLVEWCAITLSIVLLASFSPNVENVENDETSEGTMVFANPRSLTLIIDRNRERAESAHRYSATINPTDNALISAPPHSRPFSVQRLGR
jgi:hypothetical protein